MNALCRLFVTATLLLTGALQIAAEIPPATDAPKPLSAAESGRFVQLPTGFNFELIASEPLIREPSGMCWDERGQLFVCELHGYREIIEDYSAIPRYLQQQYGLTHGINHGRLWRLTHRDAPRAPSSDMSALNPDALVKEIASPHFWRRETARRLLVERKEKGAAPGLERLAREAAQPVTTLTALHTMEALGLLSTESTALALRHPSQGVRLHGLRFAERWLNAAPTLLTQVVAFAEERDPSLLLQLALTLGECKDPRVVPALARLAREHGDVKWIPNAVLSSLHQRAGALLAELLRAPEQIDQGIQLLEPICASVAARRDEQELTEALTRVAALHDFPLQTTCLRGLQTGLKGGRSVSLSVTAREALGQLLTSADSEIRQLAAALAASLKVSDPAQMKALVTQSGREAADIKLAFGTRLAAVAQLAGINEPSAMAALLDAWPANTPKVREAILDAVFSRRDRLPALLDALEKKTIPPAALTAFQRVTLLEHERSDIRERATKLLAKQDGTGDETFQRFAAALAGPHDNARGEQVFREHCSTCHQAHGLGFAVGPDLNAEFQRAEEMILKDILVPNETISAGYETYAIETGAGQSLNGILASESATSVTLRQPTGIEQAILRKEIVRLESLPVSLMPEALAQTLEPKDAANVIAWLRRAPGETAAAPRRVVLFDDEPDFIAKLNQGDGRATLERTGAFAGTACLSVTPPQRYSARIPGWSYRIVEKPAPGEYRYLRLAWKTEAGQGVMLELAANGQWPNAEDPHRRYFAGKNTTKWQAREFSPEAPSQWRVVTFDLWQDNGAFTLTGLAPTAMGGKALFDRIELLRDVSSVESGVNLIDLRCDETLT